MATLKDSITSWQYCLDLHFLSIKNLINDALEQKYYSAKELEQIINSKSLDLFAVIEASDA